MKIFLVRPDGIGDEILSLPVATELRRLMPGARLSFLSSAYAAPVLAHHPDLDEVLTVTGQERLGELVRLFKRNVDAAIFLKPFRRHMRRHGWHVYRCAWARGIAGIPFCSTVASMSTAAISPVMRVPTIWGCSADWDFHPARSRRRAW